MKRYRMGFTLVELLVVISIIALLVSILLPALGKAKSETYKVICSSNLHQMGISLVTYASDNSGKYPAPVDDGNWIFGGLVKWDEDGDIVLGGQKAFLSGPSKLLEEGYLSDPSFLFCPATKTGQLNYDQFLELQRSLNSLYPTTHKIDDIIWQWVYTGYEYWVGYRIDPQSPVYQPELARAVAKNASDSSSKVCMTDALATTTNDSSAIDNPFVKTDNPPSLTKWTMVNHMSRRTILGTNVLYNDASVSWNTMKSMLREENPDSTMKRVRARIPSLIGDSYWWF